MALRILSTHKRLPFQNKFVFTLDFRLAAPDRPVLDGSGSLVVNTFVATFLTAIIQVWNQSIMNQTLMGTVSSCLHQVVAFSDLTLWMLSDYSAI